MELPTSPRCPRCQGGDLVRSRRRGVERLVPRPLLRCQDCGERFYLAPALVRRLTAWLRLPRR